MCFFSPFQYLWQYLWRQKEMTSNLTSLCKARLIHCRSYTLWFLKLHLSASSKVVHLWLCCSFKELRKYACLFGFSSLYMVIFCYFLIFWGGLSYWQTVSQTSQCRTSLRSFCSAKREQFGHTAGPTMEGWAQVFSSTSEQCWFCAATQTNAVLM